jgi:hypothetical protein
MPTNPKLFENPIVSAAWCYPCTLGDLGTALAAFPAADLEGLRAVGLSPSTSRDFSANARYCRYRRAVHVYSYPADLTFRLPRSCKPGDWERGFSEELAYGMQLDRTGPRWTCRWEAAGLRAFILEHVLAHEIGHHVYFYDRWRAGHWDPPPKTHSEQFAESYARHHRHLIRTALRSVELT